MQPADAKNRGTNNPSAVAAQPRHYVAPDLVRQHGERSAEKKCAQGAVQSDLFRRDDNEEQSPQQQFE